MCIRENGGDYIKQSDFKLFMEQIKTAPANDPIWYCGYLFMDLTLKQHRLTVEALESRPFIVHVIKFGHECLVIPSGIGLYKEV